MILPTNLHNQLRISTAGDNGHAAAAELLIHTNLANLDDPWISYDGQSGLAIVNYNAVTDPRPGLTRSEKAVLMLAVSLADGALVDLRIITHHLDYLHALAAITAISHAAGYHHTTTARRTDDATGLPHIIRRPALLIWDDPDTED